MLRDVQNNTMRGLVVSSLVFLNLLVSQIVGAPILTVSLLNGEHVVRVSRTTKTGCTYRLLAATTRKKLADKEFVTVKKDLQPETQISELLLYERPGGKPFKAFFVLREVCGQTAASSKPVALRFPTVDKTRSTGPKRYLKSLGSRLLTVKPEVKLTQILQDVALSRPVGLTHAGDNRLFVVEQEGFVLVFRNAQSKKRRVFLDLTSKTGVTGYEQGLFAIAFHPRHSKNRRFFVHYTDSSSGESVVEEYRYSITNRNRADPETAREYLRVSQPFSNHNGGAMMFCPDGYLYISLGDGGSAGDPQGNAQNKGTLLGKILRIDVDNSENGMRYGIPGDNPFINSQGAKKQIFAYGARNIWKFSSDAALGTLWAADVGQGKREEVDMVPSGANLGWNIAEGKVCFEPSEGCDRSGLTDPVLDYGRSDGVSVTGGYVYRGSKIPELYGFYVFADYMGGDSGGGVLWAFSALDSSPLKSVINENKMYVSGFGQDAENELYVLTFYANSHQAIYRLDPQ